MYSIVTVGGITTYDVPFGPSKHATCFGRELNIYANDSQCLYDSANKLASLKMTNHDMISFMNDAQAAVEELQMFLEVDSLDEMKKKLDKYYMVMILRAIHPNFNHI